MWLDLYAPPPHNLSPRFSAVPAPPSWSNRPPKETILLDGCDFEHWLVVLEKPEGQPTRDEIIDSYIKTLAMVVCRFLEARNWNTKKTSKMLKETLKWRLEYKPEKIRWEDVAREAETVKFYRANYLDNFGRTVLVMRPGFEFGESIKNQYDNAAYYDKVRS